MERRKELVYLETVWSIVYMLSQYFGLIYALQSTPLPSILFSTRRLWTYVVLLGVRPAPQHHLNGNTHPALVRPRASAMYTLRPTA